VAEPKTIVGGGAIVRARCGDRIACTAQRHGIIPRDVTRETRPVRNAKRWATIDAEIPTS
jgi:hypothetical protein